ncbi:MAG: hypothetical protein ACI8RD_009200 [Bacillariaceae sp.]|jgi:hypothetical protein
MSTAFTSSGDEFFDSIGQELQFTKNTLQVSVTTSKHSIPRKKLFLAAFSYMMMGAIS